MDRDRLRESVDLENRADLMATACNFGEASYLMKKANKIRAECFGRGLDPNELRDRTMQALGHFIPNVDSVEGVEPR